MKQLVWFRDDLRIHDNIALSNAISKAKQHNSDCHAIYYWSEKQLRSHGTGDRKFSAIQTALNELNSSLANIGIALTVVSVESWSDIAQDLQTYCKSHQINDIHFHLQPALNE
jgi:deoxyribodipyrimidine photo-lyase